MSVSMLVWIYAPILIFEKITFFCVPQPFRQRLTKDIHHYNGSLISSILSLSSFFLICIFYFTPQSNVSLLATSFQVSMFALLLIRFNTLILCKGKFLLSMYMPKPS